MATRTHVAGAFRWLTPQDSSAQVVETFSFDAGAGFSGWDGWTLTTARDTFGGTDFSVPAESNSAEVSGDWDHPLQRGNWHRIVPRSGSQRLKIAQDDQDSNVEAVLSWDRNNQEWSTRTARRFIRPGWGPEVLVVPRYCALVGTVVERAAREATSVAVVPAGISSETSSFSFGVVELSATSVGRRTLKTPDGDIVLQGWVLHPSDSQRNTSPEPWDWCGVYLIDGNGMLAAWAPEAEAESASVWRAAWAPSRA